MRHLTPAEIQPVVRIANYHEVLPRQSWAQRTIPNLQLITGNSVKAPHLFTNGI